MANGASPPQNPPNAFDEVNGRLDTLTTVMGTLETTIGQVKKTAEEVEIGTGELKARVGDLTTAIGEAKVTIGDVKTTVGEVRTGIGDLKTAVSDVRVAVDSLRTLVDNAKDAADAAKDSADNAKTAAENAKKGSFWLAFLTGVAGAIIAAGASIWVGQRNFDAALAVAKADIDNAAKKAFESQRGAIALQDYQNGQNLIENIETEFEESAVQRSVKKELGANLHGFKLLADRLKVPALSELSDYAGRLLWAYARGDKHWDDYQKQDKQEMQQRGDKALKALEDWANNQ